MKISVSLADRAFKNAMPGINGCWTSLLFRNQRMYQLRDGSRRVSQLLVLWWCTYGNGPDGQLSNACGDSTCVNPAHYRDQSDREQQLWVDVVRELSEDLLNEYRTGDTLWVYGIDEEDGYSYQTHKYRSTSQEYSLDAAGMTRLFHCYCCDVVFDPMKSRNPVVCDDCWTDEDQAQSEEVE